MRKKYEIKFWYYTDLRHSVIIETYLSEQIALILAQETNTHLQNWCDNGKGFSVSIALAE